MTEDAANSITLAKVGWTDPESGLVSEYVLSEGARATLGRSEDNDICVRDQRVSRQHAVISYRDGVFMISDLGSANGTFVNDRRLEEAYPLASGDVIRLYVPTLSFSATVTEKEHRAALEQGTLITAISRTGSGRLTITSGVQEGETIPLLVKRVMIGRAVTNANWQVCLKDASVSRPHARIDLADDLTWVIYDLGSANGTYVNDAPVSEKGRVLNDGDVILFGSTIALFRLG